MGGVSPLFSTTFFEKLQSQWIKNRRRSFLMSITCIYVFITYFFSIHFMYSFQFLYVQCTRCYTMQIGLCLFSLSRLTVRLYYKVLLFIFCVPQHGAAVFQRLSLLFLFFQQSHQLIQTFCQNQCNEIRVHASTVTKSFSLRHRHGVGKL